MKEIAVFKGAEFSLGFQLAGIRNVLGGNPEKDVRAVLENKDIGLAIIDEETMDALEARTKEEVIASVDPVFVVVSPAAQQEELRRMIIRSIGVDLLKDGEES